MSEKNAQTPEKPPERVALKAGTVIDCYRIKKLIGTGGFSLIYLAEDEDNHDEVAIKEYLPKRFGQRGENKAVTITGDEKKYSFLRGLRLFYQEAKSLAQLKHPNIVNVRNCCLANDTAYLIMDYEPGKNLGRYVKRRKGNLSTNFILAVFPPLIRALTLIHQNNHLHLDIKPSNIHLRPGGNPLLLDFGAVYHLDDAGTKKAQVVTPGFSPIEQYYASSKVGPWTDIYAMSASIRACIEGQPPPTAVERHAEDKLVSAVDLFGSRYPANILKAIDWGMAIQAEKRPQTAAQLLDALTDENFFQPTTGILR